VKIAFHFNADDPDFNGYYGSPIEQEFFSRLLTTRSEISFSTKMFRGDLLLFQSSYRSETVGNTVHQKFDRKLFEALLESWMHPDNSVWSQLKSETLGHFSKGNVYVLCLESVDQRFGEALHRSLLDLKFYLGAQEVDDATRAHWLLYSNSLIAFLRVSSGKANIFHGGFGDSYEDYCDVALEETLKKAGFLEVKYESLNGKFSIFDRYHDFSQAKRVSDWKRRSGIVLAFVADQVVTRIGDTAPELGNKLWAAFDLFDRAETNEQYAQVSASCRRTIEYVVDSIFPPVPDDQAWPYKLGQPNYRNRLLAFADQSRKSNTNIDLIVVSTKSLAEQIEKLEALINKGVHAEFYRAEARRCIIRTILLLDDILSLRDSDFDIQSHL
jgi:hypothetical protein